MESATNMSQDQTISAHEGPLLASLRSPCRRHWSNSNQLHTGNQNQIQNQTIFFLKKNNNKRLLEIELSFIRIRIIQLLQFKNSKFVKILQTESDLVELRSWARNNN